MSRPRSHERGFTLIELMISLVMFSFAIAGILAVAVSMTAGFHEQRQAIAAESSVRVPMDFIADAIRQASPGVPGGATLTDASGTTCSTGSIVVTNSSSGPDSLDVIYASGAVVTSLRSVLGSTGGSIDVTNASELVAGDFIVVSDTSHGHLFKIASKSGNTLTLGSICSGTLNWTADYPVGSLVVRAQHARFSIGAIDGIPTLMMDPDGPNGSAAAEPLAEGVEDMQLAIGIDTDGDFSISDLGTTTDEWSYNVAADVLPTTGDLRAVRVTLVSRAAIPVTGGVTPFARPAAEDRAAGTADAYRRRVLRSTIEVRNMGASP